MTDDRTSQLVEKLTSCEDEGHAIALLWSFVSARVIDLSNRGSLDRLREEGQRLWHALRSQDRSPSRLAERIASAEDPLREAALALVVLECDLFVGTLHGRPETLWLGPYADFNDGQVRVAGRSPWIPRALAGGAPARDRPPDAADSPSMPALCHRLLVVPETANGVTLGRADSVDLAAPVNIASNALERTGLASGLTIHLATLGPPTLDGLTTSKADGTFLFEDPDPTGLPEIWVRIEQALRFAHESQASIVVLPELSVPVALLDELRTLVASLYPYPVLTVAGLRHAAVDAPPGEFGWANEAVVLGPRGTEILRQRKLTQFTYKSGQDRFRERTSAGKTLEILPLTIGMLATPICLDVFGGAQSRRIEDSPASLLLVPSLSPKVSAHKTGLVKAVGLLWGSSFVCNRNPEKTDDDAWRELDARSFWAVAYRGSAQELILPKTGMPSFEVRIRPQNPTG